MRGASVTGGKGDKRGNPGVKTGRREKKINRVVLTLKYCYDFFCLATNDVCTALEWFVYIVQVGESSARLHI